MPSVNIQVPKKAFNESFIHLLDDDNRYLVLYGGAGSGKSYFIAERYIKKLLESKMCNILVCRAVAATNRDSTFALFKQVISRWSLSKYFKYNESDLRVKCLLNGNEVIFKGLDDTEKLKSITFSKGELTDVWIEEASETDEASFNQLNVRLRGKGSKKQIVVSFNPIDVNHWLKRRFADCKDDNITFFHTTYKNNNFLDDDYVKLLESYKETDPYYYDVYCLGEWGVFGKTIFDKAKINKRINELRGIKPIRQGYYNYNLVSGHKDSYIITEIEWVNEIGGYITIMKEPEPGFPYVISGDTAGEGSDFFTAHVLNNVTGEEVAYLKQQFDEDLYTDQLYCLGMMYNTALIGIESNFTMTPIKRLQDLGYTKQYLREENEDTFTHQITKKYGFNTNKATRPVIIAGLVKIVREECNLINDIETLNEMLSFTRNEKGRPEAAEGAHDDLVMSLAIAYHIRTQQSYLPEPAEIKRKVWTSDMWEDYNNARPADRAILIKRWGNPR